MWPNEASGKICTHTQKSGYFSTLIDKYWVKQKHSAHVMAILRTQRTATNEREKMFKSKKFLFSPSPSLSLNIVKASELVSREMFVFRMWNKTRMGMKWNKKISKLYQIVGCVELQAICFSVKSQQNLWKVFGVKKCQRKWEVKRSSEGRKWWLRTR